MAGLKSDLDVVIASVGRMTLTDAVSSIRSDALDYGANVYIRIFLDTDAPKPELLNWLARQERLEVQISSFAQRRGVSAAYNAALAMVKSGLFCLFSDDDLWEPGRLNIILRLLEGRDNALLIQRVNFGSKAKPDLRPEFKHIKPNALLASILTPPNPLKTNPRTISLLGVAGTANLAQVRFDERLAVYEDVWWLHTLESLPRAPTILFHDSTAALANVNELRTVARLETSSLTYWRSRLECANQALAKGFDWHYLPRMMASVGAWPWIIPRGYQRRTMPPLSATWSMAAYTLIALKFRYINNRRRAS